MIINPVKIVKTKIWQKQAAEQVVQSLTSRYGDEVRRMSLFKAPDGTVCAMGKRFLHRPYARAIAMKPDGTTIETLVTRGIQKKNGVADEFTKLFTYPDGRCRLKVSENLRAEDGSISSRLLRDVAFKLKRKTAEIIDITQYLPKQKLHTDLLRKLFP